MAPLLGLTSTCLHCIVFYTIILALTFNIWSYAAVIYNRSSLLHIKESMESLYDDWDRYRKTFPPPFVCSSTSPDYFLLPTKRALSNSKKKLRKRGCRASIQVHIRRACRLEIPKLVWMRPRFLPVILLDLVGNTFSQPLQCGPCPSDALDFADYLSTAESSQPAWQNWCLVTPVPWRCWRPRVRTWCLLSVPLR